MHRTLAGKPGLSILFALLALSVGSVALLGEGRALPANASSGVLSITAPDTAGDVGLFTSLALDSNGYPVVSYWGAGDLKLLHCNDPNCAGGDDSITTPDTSGNVGLYTALVLDASGNPVVSYFDATSFDLKVLHCNDPNCAGGDDSITAPDTVGIVGLYTSLALDTAGNPVVSYYDESNADLKLLHCNDPNCAGGDESVAIADTTGGTHQSLRLDSSGYPVVIYLRGNIRLLHCNDPNCADGDDSITVPVPGGGLYVSLVLDTSGNPVVSYHGGFPGTVKVLHCNDPNCAGGDDSVTAPDSDDDVGLHTSIAMDGIGNPVISYYDIDNPALRLMHCNDPNCAGGGESITAPDTAGVIGLYTSLALDTAGNPVVSYYDLTNGDLKLMHCGDPNCAKLPPTPTPCPGGKVPAGGGCGTPTPTPTPGGPEMRLVVVDHPEACVGNVCQFAELTKFTLGVEIVTPPPQGYIEAASYIFYGPDLAYDLDARSAAEEIVWPECELPVRAQFIAIPGAGFAPTDEAVSHDCLTGLLPPLPHSSHVGVLVEISLTCSAEPTSSEIELILATHGDPANFPDEFTIAGTSGSKFTVRLSETQNDTVFPKLSGLTVFCGSPVAVGGVALDSELAPLGALEAAEQRSRVWGSWLAGALVAIVAVVAVLAIATGRLRSRS